MRNDHGIRISPPPGLVYCPRHREWEALVEDDSLCEWCCAPRPCDLHNDEWANEPGEGTGPSSPGEGRRWSLEGYELYENLPE